VLVQDTLQQLAVSYLPLDRTCLHSTPNPNIQGKRFRLHSAPQLKM